MKEQDIKALTPTLCPHCEKPIIIEFIGTAPKLSGIFTPEMIDEAKRDAITRISKLPVPEEISKPAIDWVNNPDTFFGPDDVDEIIKNIENQVKDESEEI